MPILATTLYPTAEQVLQRARVMANDAAISIAGDILASNQPYIFEMCQAALEELADRLADQGVNTFNKYAQILGLTASTSSDPGQMCALSYSGYFDGQQTFASPQLPADLLEPLEIWERQHGTINRWGPMAQAADSISTRSPQSAFSIWDWQTDQLFLPLATQNNDLKMKYTCSIGQITGPDSTINVVGSKNAMAALVVSLLASARGGLESAQEMDAIATRSINHIVNRTAHKEAYSKHFRKPFRGARRRGAGR
jgi:hypothetical protein